jgi:lipid-A-disaccharide synthase
MRRMVNHVLCTFPFEEEWYRARNVPVSCIGHPYFDELRGQRLDPAFVAAQRSQPGTRIALLPGSRSQELRYCLPSLLRAAEHIHQRRPDVRFLVACLRDEHARQVEAEARGRNLPLQVHVGRTPEIIHLSHSCVAVSGSVSLELLFRGKPSVILYRQHWLSVSIARVIMTCPYISLVNLLAGRMLFPEYLRIGCPAEQLAGHVLHWLEDRVAYESLCGELSALCQRIAEPGACDRAADQVLALLRGPAPRRAA